MAHQKKEALTNEPRCDTLFRLQEILSEIVLSGAVDKGTERDCLSASCQLVSLQRNKRMSKRKRWGEVNNYIIVDMNCVLVTYYAENVKEAICKYAENCGLQIALTIFEKAIQNLELVEIIELFNQNCLSDSDKIERVFTGYTTLYDEHK